MGQRIAGFEQRARQGEFGAVDGEDAVPAPEVVGGLGAAAQDGGMELAEDLWIDLVAGAGDGGGRDRVGLGQRHCEVAAVVPEFGQGGGVAQAAGCEHQPEDEQHHEQGVEDTAALQPLLIVLAGQAAERVDQLPPGLHEGRIGGDLHAGLRTGGTTGGPGGARAQDLPAVLGQRIEIDILGVPLGAALGLADGEPVGGAIAGAGETLRIDEGLDEDGLVAILLVPVGGQLADGQGQGVRGQMLDADPGQEQEARLRDDPMQLVSVLVGFPADPAVAAGQREGALLEQHRAERALLAVLEQVAQMGTDRLAVAQVVVAVDELLAQGDLLGAGDR